MRTHPTHARTLVVHRSHARTLLISCPPEATAGGSALLIDRPTPSFSPDDACAAPGSANDFLSDDLLSLVKRRNLRVGINEELIAGPRGDFLVTAISDFTFFVIF